MTSTADKRSPGAAGLLPDESSEAIPKFSIGTKVRKWFDGNGWFTGIVSSYDGTYYDVVYSDGDSEEYNDEELAAIVLSPQLQQVQVGSRVAVYNKKDDQYYEAVVSRERIDKEPLLLVYSNGNREWLDLRQYSFVLLEGQPSRGRRRASRNNAETKQTDATEFVNQDEITQDDLTRAKVPSNESTKVDCAEAPTSLSMNSNVVKSEPEFKPKADNRSERSVVAQAPTKSPDGLSNATPKTSRNVKSEPESKQKTDSNKLDRNGILTQSQLSDTTKNEASPDVNKVTVGSRVAVYKADDDHYQEAVVTQRRYIKKPFYLEYTNGNAEWVDLRRCRFRLLGEPTPSPETRTSPRTRKRETPDERGNDQGTPMLASDDGKSRKSNKRQHIEIKGKAAGPVSDGKHNQASINGELGTSRMFESTAEKSCNGAKKRDQSTQPRTGGKAKYDIGTKVKKFFEGHGWFTGKVTSYEEPYYCVRYEDGDREEYQEKGLSDILLTRDLAKVSVGSRVAVHWPDDDEYYEATVITEQNWSKTPFELEYDSGHYEWVDLRKVKFCVLASGTRRRSETVVESDTDDEV